RTTNNTSAISDLASGRIGLVRQDSGTSMITIGASTGGTMVNVAGTSGNRQVVGVALSGQTDAAATVGQIKGLTSALGGNASVAADGTVTNPTYTVQGGTQNNVGDALGALDGAINEVKTANQSLSDAAVQYDKNIDGSVNKDQVTLGGGANGTTLTNVKDGTLASNSKDAVNGGQLFTTNQQVSTNTSDISTLSTQINSGSVGLVQQDSSTKAITVAANTGGTSINVSGTDGNRTISGVEAGSVNATSNDAINGGQLYAANTNVANALGGGSKVDSSGNVTAPSYDVAGDSYNNVGSALQAVDTASLTRFDALNGKLDQAFGYTNDRIDKVEREANAGIAAALSLESAPFVPGKLTYAVGAGFHGGENAVGASLRRTSDNGRWSLTGGVATASEGGASARVGISGVIN
ncbi:YadA-like family protein, partial [Psychrobacter sp. ASPA161_6]|uniref:YadA-like family protein n=1 Tax=Psychrobacter sp. ASPA161_6 TaxID=3160962 RepID=UPI003F7FB118